ncbi:MAG: class I SAM-dependent methyltransferase [Gammaproteobacteria bacterium]|jgi:ubiquinone/menaquinone biosynthesis C-methylase UbiE
MDSKTMRLARDDIERTCKEAEILDELLALDDRRILELGCGKAEITRLLAEGGRGRHITAMEVDEEQHSRNLLITDLPNVTFLFGGAEAIPADDENYDVVLMFKSLHHVPVDKLDKAMQEIHRVLVPGGVAYISEPLYAGDFNDIMRQFHDEQIVREAAFHSLQRAVDEGLFELIDEIFFNTSRHFKDFEEFEGSVLNVTHTKHELDEDTYNTVQKMFNSHMTQHGADFVMPIRVDMLQKPE